MTIRRMQPTVHILVLAAGASSRMRGLDKLVTEIDGQSLLRRVVDAALATCAPVAVTLPVAAEARRRALGGLPVSLIDIPDAAMGMSRSIARGIQSLTGTAGPEDGVMILPGDMPELATPDLSNLIAEFCTAPNAIIRGGTDDGQAGHPTIFPRALWPELCKVEGDEGGRSVLQRHHDRVRIVPLPGTMAVLDLDTPEDWAAYLGHPIDLA
jgi:molybdenum cofactor cytidylyltransferase